MVNIAHHPIRNRNRRFDSMKSDSCGAPPGLCLGRELPLHYRYSSRFLHAEFGEGVENSKSVQEPQNHGNDYDDIQDLFD
jgi:hypothetical protein